MQWILLVLCLAVLGVLGASAEELDYDRVQTYGIVALDPEEAAEKGWSVNGLWAAFGTSEAVRTTTHFVTQWGEYPMRWSYPTREAYVQACHEAGVLVPAVLTCVSGMTLLRKRFPEMEEGACANPDGSRAYWAPQDDTYFMCSNNPIYGEVLLTLGKEAIDAGVDLIVLDEIQGNEFCFYYHTGQPGFCEHCLAAYRRHLAEAYTADELRDKFGIEDLEGFDFAKRLDGEREKVWKDADPLLPELWLLQERLNFEAKTELVRGLRAHMEQAGRMIPICGNTPGAGLGDIRGWRPKTIKWAGLLDFIAFENEMFFPLPQGKWVAFERMAAAAYRLPPAILSMYGPIVRAQAEFQAGRNRSVMFYGLLAEANANGCHYVNHHQKPWAPQYEELWKDCFRGQRFILKHRDLFEPESETGANVAVLFIENEGQRYRSLSFEGLGKALAESNIPFDVVLDGGDGYVPVTLTADKLAKYQLVIIPQALGLADSQKEAIRAYVSGGGTVLLADPEGVGISDDYTRVGGADHVDRLMHVFPVVPLGEGKFVITPKVDAPGLGQRDLGVAYFLGYDDAVRRQVANAVKRHSKPVLEVEGVDRTVSVYPHYQPSAGRIVVHVVNSDYDAEANLMRPKENIVVRLKRPDFYKEVREARILSPDFPDGQETAVTPALEGDFIELTVPRLDVYDVVVL